MHKRKQELFMQSAAILFIIVSFMSLAVIRCSDRERINGFYLAFLLLLILLFFASVLFCYKEKKELACTDRSGNGWDPNRYLYLFAVIFLILRFSQFSLLPRWDSGTYFYCIQAACQEFDFTLASFLQLFRFAGHISYGCGLFWAIGYYLFPDSFTGIYFINLLLSLAAFFMTYGLLKNIVPAAHKMVLALGTFVIWCQPMNLGIFHEITPDFGVMIFLVYLAYFHMRRQYILMAFSALMLMTAKETGVVCAAGYCMGYLIYLLIYAEETGVRRFRSIFKDRLAVIMICLGMLGVCGMVYIVFIQGSGWGSNYMKDHYGGLFNVFAFNVSYIWLKIKTLFFMNFYWVWLLVITVCLIAVIRKKSISETLKNQGETAGILGAAAAFAIFSILYVTYNSPRYNLCMEYSLAFIGVLLFFMAYDSVPRVIMSGALGIVLLMMLGEAYVTIDPVTKAIFPVVHTGSAFPMVSAGWEYNPSLKATITVYNHQYRYLDQAYDEVLETIDYNPDLDLVLWGAYERGVRAVGIDGWTVRYFWDTEEKKRTMYENPNTCQINPVFQKDFDELYENGMLKENAVWIFTPHFEENEVLLYSELRKYYHIDEKRREAGTEYGGKVYYYEMQLR